MGRQYRQFKSIQIAARLLPRRVMYWIGDRIARLYFEKDARARNAVTGNLRRILAFKGLRPVVSDVDRLALEVFRGLARNFIDFFHFTRLSGSACRRLFVVEGMHHLDGAYALGRGVIAVSGHFGAFEMAASVVTAMGYRVSLRGEGSMLSMPETQHGKASRPSERERSSLSWETLISRCATIGRSSWARKHDCPSDQRGSVSKRDLLWSRFSLRAAAFTGIPFVSASR
jgi:hypothetical protein